LKPQLPENFIPLMSAHITLPRKQFTGNHREYWQGVAVEVYGDYWENIAAFEQRKTNEKITREDAERLAAVEARWSAKEPEKEPEVEVSPEPHPPGRKASIEVKREFYGPKIARMQGEGLSISDICCRLQLGVRTFYEIVKAS